MALQSVVKPRSIGSRRRVSLTTEIENCRELHDMVVFNVLSQSEGELTQRGLGERGRSVVGAALICAGWKRSATPNVIATQTPPPVAFFGPELCKSKG